MVTGIAALFAAPPWSEGVIQSGVVVVAIGLAWMIMDRAGSRLVRKAAERVGDGDAVQEAERAKRITTLWSVGRLLIFIVLLVALALLLLDVWGISITPFLAVGSVVAVAVGFGAQNLVKDVIAGVFVIVEDQYGLGDVVQLDDTSGRVEAIRLRTTVLRDLDGYVHHVPNGSFTVATNYTQEYGQAVVDLSVGYDADVDLVLEVVGDEAARFRADPDWEKEFLGDPEVLGIEELAESSVRVRLVFKVRPASRWNVRREFLRRIKSRFDADGIVIPYPHLSVITRELNPSRPAAPEED